MDKAIVWTDSAREDVRDIFEYIYHESAYYADSVVEKIIEAADSLKEFSDRGRIVPELQIPSLRELFVYQYRLLYKVSTAQVEIIGILHMARDFSKYWDTKIN